MTPDSRNAVLIARAIAANDRLGTDLVELIATLDALRSAILTPVQPALNETSGPRPTEDYAAHWRAAHLPGTPGKIDCDPELQAFILDRIATATYAQIVAAVKAAFPPARHISTA